MESEIRVLQREVAYWKEQARIKAAHIERLEGELAASRSLAGRMWSHSFQRDRERDEARQLARQLWRVVMLQSQRLVGGETHRFYYRSVACNLCDAIAALPAWARGMLE